MNLKPRFMLLTSILFLVSAAIVWILVRQLAITIVDQWAVRYAEKQVLYDKARTLQPILREIALSRQFAQSQQLLEWARNEDNPVLKARAIREMENFRANFADHSYFVALLKSGHYYHNNAKGEYNDQDYRYTLDPKKPADQWFYDIIKQNRSMHLNVNPDVELGVTKLWIDVLMRDGNKVLGVAGTGLDLTGFINNVVNQHEPGITSLFTDHEGAIQIYRDQSLIDFASITKTAAQHKTIDKLLPDATEREKVHAIMQQLQNQPDQVLTTFVTLKGHRYLAGLAYLPEIGWYEVTLLNLALVLPMSNFTGILASFAVMLLVALALQHLALGRYIINPLRRLDEAFSDIQNGKYVSMLTVKQSRDEIGRLIQHFRGMAATLIQSQLTLEQKVRERTLALEFLSKTDPLTELLNRRGMNERLEQHYDRMQREKLPFGLIWLDLDYFKAINDQFGHEVGDKALIAVANQIRTVLRSYDSASRWGGDEFLLLIETGDTELLTLLSERIRSTVAEMKIPIEGRDAPLQMTLCAGSCLAQPGDSLQKVLRDADSALYKAKQTGRNRYCTA